MRRHVLVALPFLAAACGTREPGPAPQASPPAATIAPAATTTTTTTTTLPPPVWRTVRWGMSREEVLAALPGEAQRLPKAEAFGQPTPGAAELAIPESRGARHVHRVLFGFGSGGLDRIHLVAAKPTYDTCGELERELTEAHGAPSGRSEIATSLRGEAVTWTLPAETVTLACTERPSLGFRSVTIDHVPPGAPSPAS